MSRWNEIHGRIQNQKNWDISYLQISKNEHTEVEEIKADDDQVIEKQKAYRWLLCYTRRLDERKNPEYIHVDVFILEWWVLIQLGGAVMAGEWWMSGIGGVFKENHGREKHADSHPWSFYFSISF